MKEIYPGGSIRQTYPPFECGLFAKTNNMDDRNYTIVATNRTTGKREVIKTGLTKEAALYQSGHMRSSQKRYHKYFKAAKAKN